MRSFFFQNDGIVLDRSVRSRERTIVPQERRPVLVMEGDMGGGPTSSEKRRKKLTLLPTNSFLRQRLKVRPLNHEITILKFMVKLGRVFQLFYRTKSMFV